MQLLDVNNSEIVSNSMDVVVNALNCNKMKSTISKLPNDIYEHSIEVAFYSVMLAQIVEDLVDINLNELAISALLHDIGKLKISPNILNKPGKLTFEEYEIVKQHSQIGYDIAKDEKFSCNVCDAILSHHENENCTGYPFGTDKISLYSKIIHICDVYSALTSKRCYKEAWSIEDSLNELQKEKGIFCVILLKKFKELITDVYEVKYDNGYSKVIAS